MYAVKPIFIIPVKNYVAIMKIRYCLNIIKSYLPHMKPKTVSQYIYL